jgi:hypothetical protein
MRQKLIGALLILSSVLAACATPPASQPSAPSAPNPSGALTSPLVAAPAQANAPSGAPLIEIERSGGIAGKTVRTVVYANGALHINDAGTAQLGADAAQKLVADLDAAGFFTLQESYRSRCNDCFEYRITVHSPKQTKTISYVQDGQMPEEVAKVTTVLAMIQDQAK